MTSKEKDPFYAQAFREEFHKRAQTLQLTYGESAIYKIAEKHLAELTEIPGVFFDTDTK